MEKREDSNEGIRRELAEHRVEDAKTYGELKAMIGGVDNRLSTVWKVLLLRVALGLVGNGLAAWGLAREKPAAAEKR